MRSATLLPLSLLTLTTASPLSLRQANQNYNTSSQACAAIQPLIASQLSANPTAVPVIPAQPAWDCIQSVPLNTTAALALVKSIRPFVRWQSTTSNLKDPPAEYAEKIQGPTDVWGNLDGIEEKLNSGYWTQEYDFGYALYKAFQSTHDGHFYFNPDVVGGVFTWGRPMPLVSVSEDGEKIPAPFVYADILASSGGNATFTPSALAKINGQDAAEYLVNLSQVGSLQDRDALYNTVFYELAQISIGSSGIGTGVFSGGGRGRLEYPGPQTDIEFVNGTKITITNTARVLVDFTGIKTGEDVYNKYFSYGDLTVHLNQIGPNSTAPYGPLSMSPSPTATPTAKATATPAPGYPTPVIRQTNNLIGGYYISDPEYNDVAVLSVPSFVSLDTAEEEFQSVGAKFLAQAVADGKKKLIIDVSANGGGTILQGYDLFKQLFPSIDPYSAADRFRAHESTELIGEVFSTVSGYYPRSLNGVPVDVVNIESDVCNYRSDLEADTGKHFDSWPDKFGPEEHHGDEYTRRFRWDLSDPLITWNSGGIEIHGYGALSNYSTQPFQASNIVLVYDGYCASTCTIFSELMRQLVGVEAVAMGGRPSEDIIQAVGGTKGTNDLPWDYIQSLVETSFNYSSPEQRQRMLKSELADYTSYLPFYRAVGSATAVNFRDGIRKGDETNTPLQFRYEEADCRLFYTPEMTVDATAIWKKVADAKWKGAECVAGGLGGQRKDERRRVRRAAQTVSTAASLKNGISAAKVQRLTDSFDVLTMPEFGRKMDGIIYP